MTTSASRNARILMPPAAAGTLAAGAGVVVGCALAIDVRLGAVLALAVLCVPIALADPPLIIALWAALTVFSKSPGAGLALTATGLLAFGAWLAHARADPARIRSALRPHRQLITLIVLLLAWLTVSMAWAADPARAAAEAGIWYVNAVAVVVLVTSLRTPRDIRLVVGAVIAAVVASAALGLVGVDLASAAAAPQGATGAEGRLEGASGDPNFMAAFIVAAVVLGTVLFSAAASPWRAVLPAAIALLVVGLAATESRGGLLAFLVVLGAGVVVMRGRRAVALGLAAVALLIGGLSLAANPAALERIKLAEQDRGNGREDLWVVAQRMAADHPMTGVGLDNFTARSAEYVRRPGSLDYVELIVDRPHVVHNTYLQMLAETGVIGLGLWLALAATVLGSALRAARRFERAGRHRLAVLSRGVLVADVGLLTAVFFISALSTATVWVLLALGPVLLSLASAPDRGSPGRAARPSGRGVGYSPAVRLPVGLARGELGS